MCNVLLRAHLTDVSCFVDVAVIRGLCGNPSGFFLCGDTAQTIAAGASFRFDDLKSSFYRMEEAEPAVRDGIRKAIQPATFNLTTNYRSHGGICDAADALIKMIKELFPNSIDNLEPEKGLVHGPKPSFLTQRRETIDQVRPTLGISPSQILAGLRGTLCLSSSSSRVRRGTLRSSSELSNVRVGR